ncbi:MAG TPA: glycosyltransferase family A protein [Polyangiaceae bacterium]|nr:glycosyltransferase family A protein [Polyangiaceae bacterium]
MGYDSHSQAPSPSVSVVVPTRNRADHALACVQTILANTGFDELVVVDQSDGRETEQAISTLNDPRVRYLRSSSRGVTRGRNTGIEATKGEIIAFTDDDCRVAPDWVPNIARVFAADSQVAVVCGRVIIPEELQALGFAQTFEPLIREWQNAYPPFGSDWGITANLAVRRSALGRIGIFDPMLGPGSPMRAGEEPDFLFRALRSGLKVVNAKEVLVDHLGIRSPGPEATKLLRGYGLGTGAALFKHVRLLDPSGTAVYLKFFRASVRRVYDNVVQGTRPLGLGFLAAFLSGSVTSYKFRIDRERRQYVAR